MQELLGRMIELDPQASQALRVIACFDELCIGGVNTRALLAAAAALSGCVAGFEQDQPRRSMRVNPQGELADGEVGPRETADASSGITVWLERDGAPAANDAIILERLALCVRVRHGRSTQDIDSRRHMSLLVDPEVDLEDRRVAAAALGLDFATSYRLAVAPLFALWSSHPCAPEDVVATRDGPLHALVVSATTSALEANPCGIGGATAVEHLHHSFRTAIVSLRLCQPPAVPVVCADEFGGLIDLLADASPNAPQPDVDLIDRAVKLHPWSLETLDAIVHCGSARQASRRTGVHHSTMQARIDQLAQDLGFDPLDGYGRIRAGIAYLTWRLRRSRVMELPPPQTARVVGAP